MVRVHGEVDSAFEPLREAFVANFAATAASDSGPGDPGELGAGLCVIVEGRVVVDLWGGWADLAGSRPWGPDTLVNAYSIGKAVSAVTVLSLVAKGELDLDRPLSEVWPEYAAHDKASTTLRQVLSHQAGLPGLREPLADEDVFDFASVAARLAAEEPWWEPGTAHGYHVNTLGHLAGEPVRRVSGCRFGAVVQERVAGPLGADLWVGLPSDLHHHVAEVDFLQHVPEELRPHAGEGELDRMRRAAYFNPEGLSGIGTVNLPRWREAEVPSTNLHASARGVARFFASLVGASGGADLLPAALVEEASSTVSRGIDLVLERESRFGLGMMLHLDARRVGLGESSFGHYGNGGSLGFGDPDARVGFGYVMNRPGDRWQVPRTRRLLDALGSVLGS